LSLLEKETGMEQGFFIQPLGAARGSIFRQRYCVAVVRAPARTCNRAGNGEVNPYGNHKKTVILLSDFGARIIRPSSQGAHFVKGARPQAANTPHRLRLPGARARQAENRNIGRRTGHAYGRQGRFEAQADGGD
jgi:hypothetical protein